MRSRRWVTLSATALASVVALVAACRQIAGIGDEPPMAAVDAGGTTTDGARDAGPRCGVSYAGASCEACLESHCCSQASECAGSPACAALEACVGACQGDPSCRGACNYQHLVGADPAEDRLAACLAASCSKPCGLLCGGASAFYGPEAGAACQSCMVDNTCPAAIACMNDPECIANERCALSNYLLDRLQTCQNEHEAGADAFASFRSGQTGACQRSCGIGEQWMCVGHTSVPPGADTTLVFHFEEGLTHVPLAGASLVLCHPNDYYCDAGLANTTTDDGGVASLPLPAPLVGQAGYGEALRSDVVPAIGFWGFPFSEPSYENPPIPLVTQTELGELEFAVNVKQDANAALASIIALDCTGTPAVGVTFSVSPMNPDTVFAYRRGSSYTTMYTTTDLKGQAFAFNVPAGDVTFIATPTGLGPSSQLTVVTRPGWMTVAVLAPNQ